MNPLARRIVSPVDEPLWSAYLDCRYRNLYAPFNFGREVNTSALDDPPERPDVLHRAVLDESGAPVAVGRLDLQPDHALGPRAQLRYCAVDAAARGTGAGQSLIAHFENECLLRDIPTLWMEARVAAVNFYLRLGYTDRGEGPLKYGVIPHRVIEKRLAPSSPVD